MSEEIKEINRIIQSISDFYKMDNALKYYLDRRKANILLDYITSLQQKVEQLEKENEKLKENAEHNDKVVDKVNWENMLLKRNCNIGNEDLTFYRDKYKQLENIRKEAIEYVKSKEFAENFPYVMNECQVRSFLLNILNKGSESNVNTTN